MNINQLMEALPLRMVQVKEIQESLNNLKENNNIVTKFLENNPDITAKVKGSQVADYLMMITSDLINKRIPLSVIRNVYDQYSVIFAILTLSQGARSTTKKLKNILVDTIANSTKYDLFIKKRVNLSRISSENDVLEIFWLIPLFCNIDLLTKMDTNKFIIETKEVAKKVQQFVDGYSFFVYGSITGLIKEEYKQFLYESTIESKK